MSAGIYNFTIEQGTTFTQEFYWYENGSIKNITGYSARMMVRSSVNAPDPPLSSWTSAAGTMSVGSTDGKFSLTLTAANTAAITWTQGVYDIELVAPGATPVVSRLLKGTITIDPEVTR